jgi:hypothetical protein
LLEQRHAPEAARLRAVPPRLPYTTTRHPSARQRKSHLFGCAFPPRITPSATQRSACARLAAQRGDEVRQRHALQLVHLFGIVTDIKIGERGAAGFVDRRAVKRACSALLRVVVAADARFA